MLWVYGHYKYFHCFSARTVFIRQNLTSTDVRFWVMGSGLRPSTLPLGHAGSPQYWIFMSEQGVTYVPLKPECQSGGRTRDLRLSTLVQHCTNVTQMFCVYWAAVTTAPGPMLNPRFLEPIACSCRWSFESSDAAQFCLALWKAVKSRRWSAASKKISLCITVVIFTLDK